MAKEKAEEKKVKVVFNTNVKLGEELHEAGAKVEVSQEDYEAAVAAGVVEE